MLPDSVPPLNVKVSLPAVPVRLTQLMKLAPSTVPSSTWSSTPAPITHTLPPASVPPPPVRFSTLITLVPIVTVAPAPSAE